ncbi:unnamed protein product [Brassicogethes aeneus]|uniref:Uncharacterized protein n=1 Tax=Brassicogethes aeneus TaxID=1431903 RepID=A0A9P0B734_BRAAE|nr:unnamed protein product [Brassicogethes aeneus]
MISVIKGFLPKVNTVLATSGNNLKTFIRSEHGRLESPGHRVNNLERKFLVWTGKYKTVEEVPNFVAQNVMERARNRMRIRIANYMIVGTAVGCLIMVYSGKNAAKRGESVQQQNLEWHKSVKEEEERVKNQK